METTQARGRRCGIWVQCSHCWLCDLGTPTSFSGPCSPNSSGRGESPGKTPGPYSRSQCAPKGVASNHWCLCLCFCLAFPRGRLGTSGGCPWAPFSCHSFRPQSFASTVPSAWNAPSLEVHEAPFPTPTPTQVSAHMSPPHQRRSEKAFLPHSLLALIIPWGIVNFLSAFPSRTATPRGQGLICLGHRRSWHTLALNKCVSSE